MKKVVMTTSSDCNKKSPNSVEREAYKRNRRCLLDTNFILSCIRKKIDFFDELKTMGFQVMVPIQVVNELKVLKSRKSQILQTNSKVALELLKKRKYEKIDLQDDKVDRAIVKFSKNNKEVAIATLDRDLRDKLKSRIVFIRGQKSLEVA